MTLLTHFPSAASVGAYDPFGTMPIGASWRHGSSNEVIRDLDPFSNKVLCEIRAANRDDVDEAYASAQDAQRLWAETAPSQRAAVVVAFARIMRERKDEIISWLIRESGSSRLKALAEVGAIIREVDLAASFPYQVYGEMRPSDIPGKENRVYREPLGVITVISPWNFPMELSVRSVIPAIALGNAVVLKPSTDTPVTGGLLIARILQEAGLPPGVLNVVVGTGREIGDHIVEHRTSSFISFTGSTEVGKRVGALASGGAHIKPIALELGGNAPLVVLDDADIEQAVRAAAFGRFLHQGQICMSTNRIIVDTSIYDEFVEAFVAHVRTLPVGDPNESGTLIGPVINSSQLSSLLEKIDLARDEGAHELLGGAPTGQLLPPHVFSEVTSEMALAREESFGPIVPIIRAQNEEHALEIANDTEFGLSSAVFTRDVQRGIAFARRMEAGMTHINDVTVQGEAHMPFGGEKNSGVGRFNGRWIIEEFTRTHVVTIQNTAKKYPF